jgi:hypothetical protein
MQTEGVMPILQLSQALLTPLIAVVATYIAWQQWRSNLLKLRLERYERRLRVYEEVIRILSIIGRDANATPEDLMKFRAAAAEADFLFGPEIPEYIDEIYSRGLKLWRANKEYRDYTQPYHPGTTIRRWLMKSMRRRCGSLNSSRRRRTSSESTLMSASEI